MSVDRPTFSESWYRVAELRPALRTVVQAYRQHYRGRMWYVLRDPTNNQFFRLDDAGYHFIGMLDGNRSVAEVWAAANEQLGDRAPTQGEAIQLLGQLFTSNLLQCELPADSAGMFERYRKRVRREVGGYLMNLLFMRIPLFDPEPILEKWVHLVGWLFSLPGLLLWALYVGFGFSYLTGHWEELFKAAQPQTLLQTENIFLLYACFAGIKAIHEFGHGFACKRFGKVSGTGGEVHTMGIMLLVMAPVPYVDASSAWAFRNKWHRIIVGAGGMYVELLVAATAAIIWANTAPGTLINDICFNLIFIASVSTIMFNANPLLRYDGYYMLSDALEIPNLAQRSKDYLYYIVRKYIYRARNPRSPAHTAGERYWLFFYSIVSGIYRIFVSVAITLYLLEALQDVLFVVALFLAVSAIVGWVFTPIFKWFKYLATSQEIARTRPWAITSTAMFLAIVVGVVGFLPWPDYHRGEAVVVPRDLTVVYAPTDAYILSTLEPNSNVTPAGPALVVCQNRELLAQRAMLIALRSEIQAQTRQARADNEIGLAKSLVDKLEAVEKQYERVEADIASMQVMPSIAGQWISPNIKQRIGTYVRRGDELGIVASTDKFLIRAVADQDFGPRIIDEIWTPAHDQQREARVEIRVVGRPGDVFQGVIRTQKDVLPAGTDQLPSQALGYFGGGSVQVDTQDETGTRAKEAVFEVRIDPLVEERNAEILADWQKRADDLKSLGKEAPPMPDLIVLKSGQRVIVRFEAPAKPLAVQWWRSLKQLLQRRFKM